MDRPQIRCTLSARVFCEESMKSREQTAVCWRRWVFSRKCCRDTSLSRGRQHLAASICTVQKGGDCVAVRTAFNQHMDCDQALFNQHFGSTQKLFRQHSGNVQVVLGEHLDIVYRIIRQYLGSVQTVCMHCMCVVCWQQTGSTQAVFRQYSAST